MIHEDLSTDAVHHLFGHFVSNARPDVNHLVVALTRGDETFLVLLKNALDFSLRGIHENLLLIRNHHVVHADADASARGVVVTERAEAVGKKHCLLVLVDAVTDVDEGREGLLVEHLVDVLKRNTGRQHLADEYATNGRVDCIVLGCAVSLELRHAHLDAGVETHGSGVVGHAHLFTRRENPAKVAVELVILQPQTIAITASVPLPLASCVIETKNDVLGRIDDGTSARRREDVVRAHHQNASFHLCFDGERHVHRHLIAVEVSVERHANEWMQLERLAFDEDRLKSLNPQAMERRRAVQHHRVLTDDFVKNVPNLGTLLFNHLLCRFDGVDESTLFELVIDKRLEELERHLLRKTALMELERRTHDDHGTTRVVHALAEKVLTEAALLTLQHVRKGLQGALVWTGDRLSASTVVEQGVHRLLEHAALIADNDLRSIQLKKTTQTIVPVDHTTIEVVEIGRRETATIERNEGAQIGRKHRNYVQHHPLRAIPAPTKRLNNLKSLCELLLFRLTCGFVELHAEGFRKRMHVDLTEHLDDGFAAHLGLELVVTVLVEQLRVALLVQDLANFQRSLTRIGDDIRLAVEYLFEVLQRDVEDIPDTAREALQEPNVSHRRRQVDVPEALATHLGLNHLDAALLAHDTAVLHALVLAADALVVLHRSKDLRAEEPFALGLERTVVDRLRLLDLAVRPLSDLFRAR